MFSRSVGLRKPMQVMQGSRIKDESKGLTDLSKYPIK